jgi:hypothetical protein
MTMTEAKKIDLRKELKHLYGPSAKAVVEVDVPEMRFVKLDGEGDPNTSEAFREAVEALYSVSYALKFAVKKEEMLDYRVMPLEGLWWTEKGTTDLGEILEDRSNWRWTLSIMQPQWVTEERFEHSLLRRSEKRPTCPLRDEVRALPRGEGGTGHVPRSFRRGGAYCRSDTPLYRGEWR